MKRAFQLEEIARRLQQKGLQTTIWHDRYGVDEGVRVHYGSPPSVEDEIIILDGDLAEILSVRDRWCFWYWQWPSPSYLEQFFKTPEEVATFTERFFLCQPVAIAGWLVPLHRHPMWNEQVIGHYLAHLQLREVPNQPPLSSREDGDFDTFLPLHWSPGRENPTEDELWKEKFLRQTVVLEPEDPSSAENLYLERDLSGHRIERDKRCPACQNESLLRVGWTFRHEAKYLCQRCGQPSERYSSRIYLSKGETAGPR